MRNILVEPSEDRFRLHFRKERLRKEAETDTECEAVVEEGGAGEHRRAEDGDHHGCEAIARQPFVEGWGWLKGAVERGGRERSDSVLKL